MTNTISLASAEHLLQKSKRTLWRRLAEGGFARGADDAEGRATVVLSEALLAEAGLPQTLSETLLAADRGDKQAQCDLGVFCLEAAKPTAARYWLNAAGDQGHADALHWLGMAHLSALLGSDSDNNQGLMFLAKAAAHGHVIARQQMEALQAEGRFGVTR